MIETINKFNKGPNTDINPIDLPNDTVRDMYNVHLFEDGSHGAIVNFKGTRKVIVLGDSDLNVAGSIACKGDILGNRKQCIVFFLYDPVNRSSIKVYDVEDGQIYQIFPDPVNVTANELGWDENTVVDATKFEDRLESEVRFVDGDNPIRSINIKVEDPITYPSIRSLHKRPLAPQGSLEIDEVIPGGNLVGGSYIFGYRLFNSKTCKFSKISCLKGPVKVSLKGTCGEEGPTIGSSVGQETSKQIRLNLDISDPDFDQVQILVIKNTDGSKENQETGYLLKPKESLYGNTQFLYTGNHKETPITLTELLIDDLAIIGADSITSQDSRDFVGGFKLNEFEGDPNVLDARTIDRRIDPECEDEIIGHFRDELYAYAAYYYDENGNGVAFPLDLSGFSDPNRVISANHGEGEFDNYDGILNLSTVTYDGDDLEGGDLINFAGTICRVVLQSGNDLKIAERIPAFLQGSIDLLAGQGSNHSTSWAWKYPKREHNRFALLTTNNSPTALGLRLTIDNHPDWAVGMKIVRRKRKKDILHQIPHIPTIAVQGPTQFGDSTPVFEQGKGRESPYDFIMPKIFHHGIATNIARRQVQKITVDSFPFPSIDEEDYFTPYMRIQNDSGGTNEVPYTIWCPVMEYLYNHDGESWELNDLEGYNVEVVDAVNWIKRKKYEQLFQYEDELSGQDKEYNSLVDKYAAVYQAINSNHYLFTRQGFWAYGGERQYGASLDILDFEGFLFSEESKIEKQVTIPFTQEPAPLDLSPFDSEDLNNIRTYGDQDRLVKYNFENAIDFNSGDLSFFDLGHVNQKGLLLHLDNKIEDLTRYIVQGWHRLAFRLFPLTGGPSERLLYGGPDPDDTGRHDMELGGETFEANAENWDDPNFIEDGVTAGASWILNITRGLGDNRYGSIDDPAEWYETNICKEITEETGPLTVEVFGGDCQVSRHQIKLHEDTPRVFNFGFHEGTIGRYGDFVQIPTAYIGTYDKNIEILDLYLESECNGNFEKKVGKYPEEDTNELSLYEGVWVYEYNPGYSVFNCLKVHLNDVEICASEDDWGNSVAWSDRKIRGASGALFTDTEGLNIYRVNNIWTLDGQYGAVIKVDTLGNKALHVFQEDKVAYQPIGVDEIRTQDGQLIATGTGQVLGTGDIYMPFDYGSQHLHAIKKYNGKFYAVDRDNKVVYQLGNRGSNFKILNWAGYNKVTEEYLKDDRPIRMHIDTDRSRLYVFGQGDSEALVFNFKYDLPEGRLEAAFQDGISIDNVAYWIHNGEMYQAYAGDRGQVFGNDLTGKIIFIVNKHQSVSKIFKVLTANCTEPPTAVRCSVFNDSLTQPDQVTDLLQWSEMRNHQYFVNQLRDRSGRRSKRLLGQYMKVEVFFEGSERQELQSIATKLRKSY